MIRPAQESSRPSPAKAGRVVLATLALGWRCVDAGRLPPSQDRFEPGRSILFGTKDHGRAYEALLSDNLGDKDICIVSHHSRASRDASDDFEAYSLGNHLDYALRHNYHYYRFQGRISGDNFLDTEAGGVEDVRGGGAYWQKLSAVAAMADRSDDQGMPICRWLMWIDSDAIFTNFHVSIESILREYGQRGRQRKEVIVARETAGWPHNLINSGVFFVRNSWQGRAFLEGVARSHDQGYRGSVLPDQDGMTHYAVGIDPSLLEESNHATALAHLRPEIGIAPQRAFNSFYWVDVRGRPTIATTERFRPQRAAWHPGDFVGHFAGVKPASARLTGMIEMTEVAKGAEVNNATEARGSS